MPEVPGPKQQISTILEQLCPPSESGCNLESLGPPRIESVEASRKLNHFYRFDLARSILELPYRINPLGETQRRDFNISVLSSELARYLVRDCPHQALLRSYAAVFPKVALRAATDARLQRVATDSFGLPYWFTEGDPHFIALVHQVSPDIGRVLADRSKRETDLRCNHPEQKLYFDKVSGELFEILRRGLMLSMLSEQNMRVTEIADEIEGALQEICAYLGKQPELLETLAELGAFDLPTID